MHLTRETPNARNARVVIDGLEVTNQCDGANDEEGWVDVILIKGVSGTSAMRWLVSGTPPGKTVRRMHGEVTITFSERKAAVADLGIDPEKLDDLGRRIDEVIKQWRAT